MLPSFRINHSISLRPGAGETIGPLTALEPFTVCIRVYTVISFSSSDASSSSSSLLLNTSSPTFSSSQSNSSSSSFQISSPTYIPSRSSTFAISPRSLIDPLPSFIHEVNPNVAVESAAANVLAALIPILVNKETENSNNISVLSPFTSQLDTPINICVELWTNTPCFSQTSPKDDNSIIAPSCSVFPASTWHAVPTVCISSTLQPLQKDKPILNNGILNSPVSNNQVRPISKSLFIDELEASGSCNEITLVIVGEFRAVVIPSGPGKFEFTARCKDFATNEISWPSGYGANASVIVSFEDSSLPFSNPRVEFVNKTVNMSPSSQSPSQSHLNYSTSIKIRRVFLKGFYVMLSAVETRAFYFLRKYSYSTQPPFLRLVCYYLALLACEIVCIRGEDDLIAASLIDILLATCILPSLQSSSHQIWASSRSLLNKLLKRYLGDHASQRAVQSLWMVPIQEQIINLDEYHSPIQASTNCLNKGTQYQRRSILSFLEAGLGIETPLGRKMGASSLHDPVILELFHSILKSCVALPIMEQTKGGIRSLCSIPMINLLVYCAQVAKVPALAIATSTADTFTCGFGASTHGLKAWIQNILLVLFSYSEPTLPTPTVKDISTLMKTAANMNLFSLSDFHIVDKQLKSELESFPPLPILESGISGKVFGETVHEASLLMGVCEEVENVNNLARDTACIHTSLKQTISESIGAAFLLCVATTSAKVSQSLMSEVELVPLSTSALSASSSTLAISRNASVSTTQMTPPPTPPRSIRTRGILPRDEIVLSTTESMRYSSENDNKTQNSTIRRHETGSLETEVMHFGGRRGSFSPVLPEYPAGKSSNDRSDSPLLPLLPDLANIFDLRTNKDIFTAIVEPYFGEISSPVEVSPSNVSPFASPFRSETTPCQTTSARHSSSRGFHSHNHSPILPSSPSFADPRTSKQSNSSQMQSNPPVSSLYASSLLKSFDNYEHLSPCPSDELFHDFSQMHKMNHHTFSAHASSATGAFNRNGSFSSAKSLRAYEGWRQLPRSTSSPISSPLRFKSLDSSSLRPIRQTVSEFHDSSVSFVLKSPLPHSPSDVEAYGTADYSPPAGFGPTSRGSAIYLSGDAILQLSTFQTNFSICSPSSSPSCLMTHTSQVPAPSIRELLSFSLNALKEVSHLHVSHSSPSSNPLVMLITSIAHCIVRLSPSTFPEYELLLRCAVQMSAVDEGISRYMTSRVLISWPRSDSEKERAMLQLVAALVPLWCAQSTAIEALPLDFPHPSLPQSSSCAIISSVLPSHLVPDFKQIMRRTCSRVCLSITSKHAAVANEAVLLTLPKPLNASGRISGAVFGMQLLQQPAALVAVARVLERNAGALPNSSDERKKKHVKKGNAKEKRSIKTTVSKEPVALSEAINYSRVVTSHVQLPIAISGPPAHLLAPPAINRHNISPMESSTSSTNPYSVSRRQSDAYNTTSRLESTKGADDENCDSASFVSTSESSDTCEGLFTDFLSVTLSDSTDFDDNMSDMTSVISGGCESEDGLDSRFQQNRQITTTSSSASPRNRGLKCMNGSSICTDEDRDDDDWEDDDDFAHVRTIPVSPGDIIGDGSRRRSKPMRRRGRVLDIASTTKHSSHPIHRGSAPCSVSTTRSHSVGSDVKSSSIMTNNAHLPTQGEKRSAQRKACRLVISGLVVIDAHKKAVDARSKEVEVATASIFLDKSDPTQQNGIERNKTTVTQQLSEFAPPLVYQGSGHWSTTIRCNSVVALQLLKTTMVDRLADAKLDSFVHGVSRSKNPQLFASLEAFVESRRRNKGGK
jgi:hypothetical protein